MSSRIREELRPEHPDPAAVQRLAGLATSVVHAMDSRQSYDALVSEFCEITGETVTIADFDAASGSMDMYDFAKSFLMPRAIIRDDINRWC